MNLENICNRAIKVIKEVAEFIEQEKNNLKRETIEHKGTHDFVTFVDKAAENKLVDGFKKIIPEAGFIAEEGTGNNELNRYIWIIDPIDGTTNYIHHLPPYSISVALMHNQQIIMGIVYEITLNECFYSWQGSNAWLNGNKISVSNQQKVKNSFIATGFPYINFERIEPYMKLLQYLMQNTPGVRRLGSAAVDLAYVACGRFEAFFEYNLKPWDVAAGTFIVQQSGGMVTDFRGGDDYIFGKEMIATNGNIHQEFTKIVNDFMNP